MEPFRCIIDKTLLKVHNLKQFNKKDFGFRAEKYYLSYQNSGKYAKIFMEEILRHKEDIYSFIRNYYYFLLNGEGEVVFFNIR